MTQFGEDDEVPAPTCHMQAAKCDWHYGIHRCELRAGHEAHGMQHRVVLTFDAKAPVSDDAADSYGLPQSPSGPARCEACEHATTEGCAIWSARHPLEAGICRTFQVRR